MSTINGHSVIPMQKRHFHWELPEAPLAPRSGDNPLHIDLLRNAQDNHCATLAAMGFGYDCIAHHTGLTKGQIATRLKRHGISPKHYRQGKTVIANLVIQRVGDQVAKVLNNGLMELEQRAGAEHRPKRLAA